MSDDRYYLRFKGRVLGPFTREKAIEMVKRGQITRQHELSPDGAAWSLAETYEEFFPPNRARANTASNEAKTTPGQEKKGSATEWFAHFDGANQGPVDEDGMRAWIAASKVTGDTMIWKSGMASWLEAELVRPEWFVQKTSRAVSVAKESIKEIIDTEAWSDETTASITSTVLKSRGWMLFLGIFGIVSSVLGAIGSTVLFISEISSPGSGPAKAVPVIATLIQIVSWVVILFISILLIRITSRMQVLHFQPTAASLHATFLAYNRFWTTLGVFVLVWLTVVMFFVAIVVASGVSIVSAGLPFN
jgi:hypothetical protein